MNTPTISVVLPVFREGPRLRGLLDRLLRQTWPRDDMEIIVADGGSGDDETEAVCAEYAQKYPVRFLAVPSRGRAQGLNHAIRAARAPFVARADGRSMLPDDYLESLFLTIQRTGAMVVGGMQRAVAPAGADVWQRAITTSMNSVCGAGPANHRVGTRSGPNDNVYLGIYRKELFDRIGYFDEESPVISEEVDLHYRAINAGGIVWLDTGMAIPYEPRRRVIEQFKLYYRYGGAKAAFILKYGKLITLRQLITPGFYITLLGLLALGLFWRPALLAFIVLLLLYTGATFACALRETLLRNEASIVLHVTVVSMAMHFGYALGYFKRLMVRDKPGTHWGG
jgi:glycosyltransferase involved in cell wall biosynthesis